MSCALQRATPGAVEGLEEAAVPLRRNRDFQLLWGRQAISLLGSQTSNIAYPLLVLAGMAVTAAAATIVTPIRHAGRAGRGDRPPPAASPRPAPGLS